MGIGLEKKRLFTGLKSPAIAHNEPTGAPRFSASHVPERALLGNRIDRRSRICFPHKKKKFAGAPKAE
jgi:hypothetical protein